MPRKGFLGIFLLTDLCLVSMPGSAGAQTIERVNVASDGAQAGYSGFQLYSYSPAVSADGRYVAFQSYASNLVPGDTNNCANPGFPASSCADIFVRDRQTGQTTRVSVATGGGQALGRSESPSISGDGRFVSFLSYAPNLVAGDTNDFVDAFVHDRQTGQTTRVNVATGGQQANAAGAGTFNPSISSDGRYVTFGSYSTNLVAGDTNNLADVFVHDRQTGQTTRVSVATGGGQANGFSFNGRFSNSADGRYIIFSSDATNLDASAERGVFVHDRQSGQTTRISVTTGGAPIPFAGGGSISADGRYVTFDATDTSNASNLYYRDRQTGQTTRFLQVPAGRAAGGSLISGNARYIVFHSSSTTLVSGDTNQATDLFRFDRILGTLVRVSVGEGGAQATGSSDGYTGSGTPAISYNGGYVAFESSATNLVANDTNNAPDIFLKTLPGANPWRPRTDFDGDGKADIALFRPSTGVWYIRGAAQAPTLGGSGDVPLAGDFDGDGKADVAVYRPSTGSWFINRSTGGTTQQSWGGGSDRAVPGDYDGDGRTDIAVFRPSTGIWYVLRSSGGSAQYTWGGTGDVPVQADYDGDAVTDVAIFRPSTGVWYLRASATGVMVQRTWGGSIDVAVPGDYDGDGKADIAVFRPSTSKWYILLAAGGSFEYTWGGSGDVPVPEDYDGDGRTDVAIFRPSTGAWFIIQSSTNTSIGYTWGGVGDLPIAGR